MYKPNTVIVGLKNMTLILYGCIKLFVYPVNKWLDIGFMAHVGVCSGANPPQGLGRLDLEQIILFLNVALNKLYFYPKDF